MRFMTLLAALAVSIGAHAAEPAFSAFVVLGPNGVALVRVITEAQTCPTISVNGRDKPMTIRAPAETVPLRPTLSAPDKSKPSVFNVTTCEATLPIGTAKASVLGRALPVPKPGSTALW